MSRLPTMICMMSLCLLCACVEPPPPITQMPEDMTQAEMDLPDADTGLDTSPPLPDSGGNDMPGDTPGDIAEDLADMEVPCSRPTTGSIRFLGEGTEQAPYEVCDAQQVRMILLEEQERAKANREGAYYVLLQDIDMSGVSNWKPIPCFRGTLDGQGHTLSGIRYHGTTQPGGCSDSGAFYTAGFIVELAPGAEVTHIEFADFEIGTRNKPLPATFDDGEDLFLGGIFGRALGATFSQLEVTNITIWSKGFVGGIIHSSLDSNWSGVKATGINIYYEWGQVGGFARWFKTLNAPAAVAEDIDIDAALIQQVAPTTVERGSHAYGLLYAQTEGPFVLRKATVTGTISHKRTPQGGSDSPLFVSYIGGVAGRQFDAVDTTDPSDRAKQLRELNILIEDVKISEFSMPQCNTEGCGEVGALFGRMGRSTAAGNMIDYAASPVFARDIEISGNTLHGKLTGAFVGRRLDGDLNIDSASIHGNTLTSLSPDADSCLIHGDEVEQDITVVTLCASSDPCTNEELDKACAQPAFSSPPWKRGASPPELERE